MTRLVPADLGDDTEVQCTECEAVFTLIFRRTATVWRAEYCPFCGEVVTSRPGDEDE